MHLRIRRAGDKNVKIPKGELAFVQISDSHMGFDKLANPDVVATFQAAIDKINALPIAPKFILHTGDVSHLAKPAEFDNVEQTLKSARTSEVFYVPGEHDYVIATWTHRKDLSLVVYCNFCGVLLAAVPAALTVVLAWQWELEGRRLKGILLMHLLSGSASLMLIAAVWWVHRRFQQPGAELPASRWWLEVLAVALVTVTGHLGGFLTGVNHP